MSRGYFIIDGFDSRNYGVYVNGAETFGAPKKEYTFYSVPARNGDILGTEKRFENIQVNYHCFIYSGFNSNIKTFRNILLSRDGYVRLEDSYHANEYRMAAYTGEFDPDVLATLNAGEFDITFNCMPQRWLTSGETTTTITDTSSHSFNNTTYFPAKPFLRAYGYGTITVGSYRIVIASYTGVSYIDIDCERMDCYSGTRNMNSYVSIATNSINPTIIIDFPELKPKYTTSIKIADNSTLTKLEVTPRWWTL